MKNFIAKFGDEPDAYNGRAYDTMILLASVMRQFGTERKAIKEGLGKIKDVPSVVYGKVAFDTETRRVANPLVSRIVVKDGKWAAWDGAHGGDAIAQFERVSGMRRACRYPPPRDRVPSRARRRRG